MVTLAALPRGDTLSLTRHGRAALERYTTVLRQLLGTVGPAPPQ